MAGALRCMAQADQANNFLHILDQFGKTVYPASCIYPNISGHTLAHSPAHYLYPSAAANFCLCIADHEVRAKNFGPVFSRDNDGLPTIVAMKARFHARATVVAVVFLQFAFG